MKPIPRPCGITAIAIFAGYSGILCLVVGVLWMRSEAPGVVSHLGGISLVFLGAGFFVGIFGLCTSNDWGRRLLRGSFFFCLPLYGAAIFPIFENNRMTIGNTLLQTASIFFSLGILHLLSRSHAKVHRSIGGRTDALDRVSHPAAAAYDAAIDDHAFTFDRYGKNEEQGS